MEAGPMRPVSDLFCPNSHIAMIISMGGRHWTSQRGDDGRKTVRDA